MLADLIKSKLAWSEGIMEQDTRPENAPMLPPTVAPTVTAREKAVEAGADDDSPLDAEVLRRARLKATCAQCLVAGAVFLLSAGCGFPIGFSAVALPQLRAPNSSLPTDENMGSWIASVHSAATPIGAFTSGIFTEKLGRRTALQITVLPFLVGWSLVALARSHAVLIAGRAVAGLAVGLSAAPAQVLISEVAEPRTRGALAGTPMVSYSLGIVCVYVLGAALPWRVVAWLGTGLPLLAFVALSLLPESPTWLVRRGKLPKARQAMRWLRGGASAAKQADHELDQLVERLRAEGGATTEKQESAGDVEKTPPQTPPPRENCLRAFSQPSVYKPFLLVTTLNILQIFSGTYLVIFYAVDLIHKADPNMDQYLAAVLTAVVRLVFTAVACVLLSWTGRRPLALFSGTISGVAAVALGTVLYMRTPLPTTETVVAAAVTATLGEEAVTEMQLDMDIESAADSDPYAGVIMGCLLIYMAANTCGFFVLPLITIGELLPAKVRGLAGGYIFASFNIGLFAITKVFPSITAEIGPHGVFWIFGLASLAGTIFIYVALPETKGQSLAQIEDYFQGENFFWITRHKYRNVATTKV